LDTSLQDWDLVSAQVQQDLPIYITIYNAEPRCLIKTLPRKKNMFNIISLLFGSYAGHPASCLAEPLGQDMPLERAAVLLRTEGYAGWTFTT
jgi:hypothetical protein